MRRRRGYSLFLLITFLGTLCFLSLGFAQQLDLKEQAQADSAEKTSEKIVPSPSGIKEATGIYVFIAWMWISIIVLVYFLRLKIIEVDRLYRLKFFSSQKK